MSVVGGGEEGAAVELARAAARSVRPKPPVLPSASPRLRARLRSTGERQQRRLCILAPL